MISFLCYYLAAGIIYSSVTTWANKRLRADQINAAAAKVANDLGIDEDSMVKRTWRIAAVSFALAWPLCLLSDVIQLLARCGNRGGRDASGDAGQSPPS